MILEPHGVPEDYMTFYGISESFLIPHETSMNSMALWDFRCVPDGYRGVLGDSMCVP